MSAYSQAKNLLLKVATEKGFLASANDISNYKRVWARDGVICGLAGLMDGDEKLVEACRKTLLTLANYQHEQGNIPSNVEYLEGGANISFGGLAGRVDTISWFIIGVCNYSFYTKDDGLLNELEPKIRQGFQLMHAWEFNDGDLMYVPRSGNWADEYPTQGYILYDQLLRLWAIRAFLHFKSDGKLEKKAKGIEGKLLANYKQRGENEKVYHPKAYGDLKQLPYWAASLEPAGYQTQFDAMANSLVLLLGLAEDKDKEELLNYTESTRNDLKLGLLPAFWPVIEEGDEDWRLLLNNCKYEFRNHPFEFHNGGTWQMVNGFYGLALLLQGYPQRAKEVLEKIDNLNEKEEWSFYENFNSKTGATNGVPYCSWSAAAAILVQQGINGKRLLTGQSFNLT